MANYERTSKTEGNDFLDRMKRLKQNQKDEIEEAVRFAKESDFGNMLVTYGMFLNSNDSVVNLIDGALRKKIITTDKHADEYGKGQDMYEELHAELANTLERLYNK